jgi:hypothetical protein
VIAKDISVYLSDPFTTLPQITASEKVVEEVIVQFDKRDGITYSLYFGDVKNQKLYAVSIYPEQSRKLPGKRLNVGLLRTFLRENSELLRDPRNCVGVWYDAEQDSTYLDVSTILPEKTEAVRLGIAYNQIGIYDLERLEVVVTEGSGEEIENLPPLSQRLPGIERSTDHGNNKRDKPGNGS